MATGSVRWFDRKRGFGFITPDMGPRDVFVHVTSLRQSAIDALDEGDRVQFELIQLKDGRLTAQAIERL